MATGLDELFYRIEALEGSLGDGFEAKYSRLVGLERYPDEVEQINTAVRGYFARLELPDHVTPYDQMILGLREKDAIFTFNWDPFLLQALRRCSGVAKPPSVHFLHGCVAVALCGECKVRSNAGLPCPRCGKAMEPSQLLFPVTDKDYDSDPVILGEWNALRNALDDAYFVTIFGYSAPVTDVAARKILIDTFSSNKFREMAEVEIIDIRERAVIEETWSDFYFSHHYGIFDSFEHSQIHRHFRRSCDAFAMASLQCHPVPENTPAGITEIGKLQEYARPLFREEQADVKFWDGHVNPFGG
ncbi:hypothetical protein Q3O60_10145 [Alkalimonas collagenimarina]|uniref:Deacetylase sirtuin-type domain-containing protein n=1 Tax=Alkalimonas collagenimarina TaxID=400390 RepID=A0ABT9GZT1_9GAMM|nr:hypothetical protein [Alkalimonas collagenimarina]MDP4536548.1 hypothetical protein [Alkalimonas collagenimarina]